MIYKQLNRLQQIDQLIRQKRTGNAEELAQKLRISRRLVYYWLDELKDMGLEIDYNREVKSFIYQKPYQINVSFEINELTYEESMETQAGINFFQKKLQCAI